MKSAELTALQATVKPCPFCAGGAMLAPMKGAAHWWRVRCDDYHCGGTTWAIQSPEDAVSAWNRRASDGKT